MTLHAFIFQPQKILDGIEGSRLRFQIIRCLQQNPDVILINFANVTFMDSIGLGSLVGALKHVHDSGKQLYLCSICEQVEAMFRLTSMDKVFTIFPDYHSFERDILDLRRLEHLPTIGKQAS